MMTFEEQKAQVARLNLMDDVFFQKVAEDRGACEEIVRILLQRPDLNVIEHQIQRSLRNIEAHSVVLDLLCQDEKGNYINIEVQKSDDDDHQRRVRFNHSNIDTMFVEKGLHYSQIPDVYVIFISNFDPFGEHRTIYHIQRVIAETGTVVDNGLHELYANTAVDDGTDISKLMQYFRRSTGSHPGFERLSNQVRFFKETNEGVLSMSEVVQEIFERGRTLGLAEGLNKGRLEGRLEGRTEGRSEGRMEERSSMVMTLFKRGFSVDFIAELYPTLTRSFLESIQEQYLSTLN